MKKIIAMVSGLLMAVTLALLGPAAPANAYASNAACVSYDGVKTCVTLGWERQTDGTGIRLTHVSVNTVEGCGKLESSPPYAWETITIGNVGTINVPTGACNWTTTANWNGPATGGANVYVDLRARVDWQPDKTLKYKWNIQPNGSSSIQYAYWTDGPCC